MCVWGDPTFSKEGVGVQMLISKKPISFVIFQGGGPDLLSPSGSAHDDDDDDDDDDETFSI